MNYQLECETNEVSMLGLTLVEIINDGWSVDMTLEDEDGNKTYVRMESYEGESDIAYQSIKDINPEEAVQLGMATQKEVDDQVRKAKEEAEKRSIKWKKQNIRSNIKDLKAKGFTARELTKIINGKEE